METTRNQRRVYTQILALFLACFLASSSGVGGAALGGGAKVATAIIVAVAAVAIFKSVETLFTRMTGRVEQHRTLVGQCSCDQRTYFEQKLSVIEDERQRIRGRIDHWKDAKGSTNNEVIEANLERIKGQIERLKQAVLVHNRILRQHIAEVHG